MDIDIMPPYAVILGVPNLPDGLRAFQTAMYI
jgi:hypothetical protein